MTMLAETVDAVIGTGTHRDTHEVEIVMWRASDRVLGSAR